MAKITVNFNEKLGKIKPMHAIGQPPMLGVDCSCFKYLKEAHIPYSRLHDVAGSFGGGRYVDIPNIFPDFNADENNPASYDFEGTDYLLGNLMKHNCEPYYRLGVTIENPISQLGWKPRRTYPPSNPHKWARICEHIIRHYNEGWADGYFYNITYWEIWNEPCNNVPPLNQMWSGTDKQFFELFDVTAKHLKNCFGNSIKVGGYSSCGMGGLWVDPDKYGIDIEKTPLNNEAKEKRYLHWVDFFVDFVEYAGAHKTPIDFFSFHSYAKPQTSNYYPAREFIIEKLKKHGYENIELHLNEWNTAPEPEQRDSSFASSGSAAMMISGQNSILDMLMYYDARLGASPYGGMFNPITYEPFPTYYSFKAFGELYVMGTQVKCEADKGEIFCVAATNETAKGVLLTNYQNKEEEIETNLIGNFDVYLIDVDNYMTKIDLNTEKFTLKAYQTLYIENK